ncbi:MAG: hypothetical protein V3T88_03940 [Nitrosomonadaceae bacterium]
MKTIKLINKLVRIQSLTESEKRSTAAALNNSKAVIGCITDYLGSEVAKIDKELADPTKLYQTNRADQYVAFRLAERARNMKLLRLLTEEVEILDADPAKDI